MRPDNPFSTVAEITHVSHPSKTKLKSQNPTESPDEFPAKKGDLNQDVQCPKDIPPEDDLPKAHHPGFDHRGLPPNPDHRVLAGHVSRKRNDNPVHAEPPPSNPRRTTPPDQGEGSNRRRNVSRRPGNNGGDESDSDSDSDRRRDHSGDSVAVSRRKKKAAVDSPANDFPLAMKTDWTEAEDEWLKKRRDLTKVAKSWDAICQDRVANQNQSMTEMTTWSMGSILQQTNYLTRFEKEAYFRKLDITPMISTIRADLIWWEKIRADFLNRVLYDYIEEKPSEACHHGDQPWPHVCSHYVSEVIHEVELDFVNLLSTCGLYDLKQAGPFPGLNFIASIRVLYKKLRSSPERQSIFKMLKVGETTNAVESPTLEIAKKALAEAYFEAVTRGEMHDPNNPPVLEFVKASRGKPCLSRGYLNWVKCHLPGRLIKQCCHAKMHEDMKAKAAEKYRRAMVPVIRQEFCQGVLGPWEASLVLFKRGYPVAIRDLSDTELEGMGWTKRYTARYGRFEETTIEGRSMIRIVDMDGRVIGLWGPGLGVRPGELPPAPRAGDMDPEIISARVREHMQGWLR